MTGITFVDSNPGKPYKTKISININGAPRDYALAFSKIELVSLPQELRDMIMQYGSAQLIYAEICDIMEKIFHNDAHEILHEIAEQDLAYEILEMLYRVIIELAQQALPKPDSGDFNDGNSSPLAGDPN